MADHPPYFSISYPVKQRWPLSQVLLDRDEILRQLQFKLQKAQYAMKHQADKKHRDIFFQVGDLVFVKLQPHRLPSVSFWIAQKLAPW